MEEYIKFKLQDNSQKYVIFSPNIQAINMSYFKKFLGSFPKQRQHGAWAMFLVPAFMALFLNPAMVYSSLLLIFSFILIFLAHQPAGKFLRFLKITGKPDSLSFLWVLLLAGSGFLISGFLLVHYQRWDALILGGIVGLLLLMHLWMTLNKEALSITAELIGVLGLTASAPFVYIFNNVSLDAEGWVLWMLNFLYFSGSIFYIKLKLRWQPSHPEPSLPGKIKAGKLLIIFSIILILYLFVTIKIRGYSLLFMVAFLPFFLKAAYGLINWNTKGRQKPKSVGLLELKHSMIFLFLTLLAFHLPL